MTGVKGETDLCYGEPLYCLALFFPLVQLLDCSPELGGLSSPKCDLWSFSTCRFNTYRHGELWPRLLNCICFEVRANRLDKNGEQKAPTYVRFRCSAHPVEKKERKKNGGQLSDFLWKLVAVFLPQASVNQFLQSSPTIQEVEFSIVLFVIVAGFKLKQPFSDAFTPKIFHNIQIFFFLC